MRSNDYLKEEIIERSFAKTWKEAKKEWQIDYSYNSEDREKCICGHYPLFECVVIKNIRNHNDAVVDSVCARKFIDFSQYDPIWASFFNLLQDPFKSLNLMAAGYAFDKNWINDFEYDFSTDSFGKTVEELSVSEKAIRITVNRQVALLFLNFHFKK